MPRESVVPESIRIAHEADARRRQAELDGEAVGADRRTVRSDSPISLIVGSGQSIILESRAVNISGQVIANWDGFGGGGGGNQYVGGTGEHLVTQYEKAKKLLETIDLDSEEAQALLNIIRVTPADQIKQNIKGSQLVKEWLTPEEWQHLNDTHYVIIHSKKYKGRTYVVYENPSRRVEVWNDRQKIAECCGIVSSQFAEGDKLLTKISAIKEDEDYYLEHSNITCYTDEAYKLKPEKREERGYTTNNELDGAQVVFDPDTDMWRALGETGAGIAGMGMGGALATAGLFGNSRAGSLLKQRLRNKKKKTRASRLLDKLLRAKRQ